MIVDLFAGAGGWAAGLHLAGVDPSDTVGIETDRHAAATHHTAGFPCAQADVTTPGLPQQIVDTVNVDGLIASPPCQAFSLAGHGHGRDAIDALLQHIDLCADGWIPPDGDLCADDVRADLTLQPLRWADTLRPRWIALEQVPTVLPAWEHIGRVLDGWGYSTWCGVLSAERYGVPQTRRRAILVARRDGPPAAPPPPTHHGYDPRNPDVGRQATSDLLGGTLLPWVSMAQALGWGYVDDVSQRRDSGPEADRAPRPIVNPSYTIRANGSGSAPSGVEWAYVASSQANAAVRTADLPVPTIMFANRGNEVTWKMLPNGQTGQHTAGNRPRPTTDPAATITGAGTAAWIGPTPSTRVTTQQAAALQTFPSWWPWQGPKTSIYRQIGNAVPPLLAAAILQPLVNPHSGR